MNSIDIFPWNENFNTELAEIDAQHKKLVGLLNSLAGHVASKSDLSTINSGFDEFTAYAAFHFQAEEALWNQYLPDDTLEIQHKNDHGEFLAVLLRFKQVHDAKAEHAELEKTLSFLARCLAGHMLETDRYLAQVVLRMRAGLSLEVAKRQAHENMAGAARALIDIILSSYQDLSANTLRLMRELSQHKQDDEFLRKLLLAVKQSPSAIVITDLDGNIEFVNDAFVQATGYSREETVGKNTRMLKSGKTADETYRDMWESLAKGRVWRGEFINKRKDGGEYTEAALISPVHQPDGTVTHFLAVNDDITERKRVERALQDSHQHMEALLNSMAEGVYGVDTEGNCRFVNQSFLRILGYASEDLIGKPIHGIIHHSHQDGSHYPAEECKMYMAYRNQKDIHIVDEVFWCKDGTPIPVEYRAQPMFTDGVLIGAIATFIDISERKKAEKAALQNAEYARSLIEASLDPLVTISLDGKITDVNTATEQATGLAREHLVGSEFAAYFTEPDKARAGYQRVFSEGFVTDYPLAIRHVSGRVTDVLYNANLYRDREGKVLGVFAAARDITERKRIEARLVDSELHLRTIIQNEPECIKIVDANGTILQMNPAGLAMLEADSEAQVVGNPVLSAIAPQHKKAFADLHRRILAGENMHLEYEVIGLKGGRRWLETNGVPMTLANGEVVHLAVTRDITARRQAEHQLRIAATVFESQEGMMVTDADNLILRVNKAFTEITGYQPEDVIGKNPSILQSARHDSDFYAAMWQRINEHGAWEGEIWNRRKNGEIYPEYLAINAVKDQDGRVAHYVGTLTDITLRKSAAEEIERLAFYDPLTGLPNRRLLQERLKPALAKSHRSGRKGALLFIDIDNFKTLNDTLGHDMGDLLLQQVASRLQSCVRENDTVARLGGDEFVVMLEGLSMDSYAAAKQAKRIGQKILDAINKPFKLGKHDYISTPSIGATLFSGVEQADEMLKQADIAMYQAKTSGRNALCFFDPIMQDRVIAKATLENELRKAFSQRQFQLYYQIQVNAALQPVGVEALIRWFHPERGMVAPAEFIPLAEENGMILDIGRWVLEQACAQLKAWQQLPAARGLVLSVNVSPKQFFQIDFVAQVLDVIQKYAIEPGLLKLELTESILIEKIDNAIATMCALGAIGVQFSLDDFGTGYSSLQYLKKLPLNQLKIDQSFVRDIAFDSGDQSIVRTIIAMAKSLNLDVIAEGVETDEQRLFLLHNDCNHYQGYLFGPPVPVQHFEALLQ